MEEPQGSYPMLELTREGRLVKEFFKTYGGPYIAQESYSAMFKNRLLPFLRELSKELRPYLLGVNSDAEIDVDVTVTPPELPPILARVAKRANQQYNSKLRIIYSANGVRIWSMDILVPVVVGSRHCLTYGKTPRERQAMGIGSNDTGGYVINGRGGVVIVRPVESAHPLRPKIINSSTSLADARKIMKLHTEGVRYVISFYAKKLEELHKVHGFNASMLYRVSEDKKAISKSSASKRSSRASSVTVIDEDEEEDAEEYIGRMRTIIDIFPAVVKSNAKKATPPIIESYMVRSAFENIYALTTSIEIFAIEFVYYVRISLPNINRKIFVKPITYVPMGLGITALGAPLISAFHALFYARRFFNDSAMLEEFYTSNSMRTYVNEIEDAISSTCTEEDAPYVKAAIHRSIAHYQSTVGLLTPFEFFTSFYSESPSNIEIYSPHDLVKHVIDYIVPLTAFVGTDKYIAKARTLATMLVAQLGAVRTRDTSDLDKYRNKFVACTGETVFRFIRERVKLALEIEKLAPGSKVGDETRMIGQGCILSSFRPHDGKGMIRGENTGQAVMNLPIETGTKKRSLMRIIAVHGSAHMSQQVRMVKDDQIGAIDPMYTPESGDVGLRKELGILGLISNYRDPELVSRYVRASVDIELGAYHSLRNEWLAKNVDSSIKIRRHGIIHEVILRLKNVAAAIANGPEYFAVTNDSTEFQIHDRTEILSDDVHMPRISAISEVFFDGNDVRLLYINGVPSYYISREYYEEMKHYFHTNGPVREGVNKYGIIGNPEDRHLQSRVQTFDIVFSDIEHRYSIYSTGGIVGHICLKCCGGKLVIDSDPNVSWTTHPDALIDAGAAVFVTPLETYFECSSVQKFYDTPSILDMPDQTRDVSKIAACNDLCHWCWHLAAPGRESFRLDDEGQETPGRYASTWSCASGHHWHQHCLDMWKIRSMTSTGSDSGNECPMCVGSKCLPPPPYNFREDYDYCTIDPATMLSGSSSYVPYANESNGVRVAYQANMGFQSGDSQPGIEIERELNSKQALEADVSCCDTEQNDSAQRDNHSGVTLMAAVRMMPYNNEDAVYVSETAARDAFRYIHFNTFTASAPMKGELKKHKSEWVRIEEEFMGICPSVDKSKFMNIDPKTGLPKIGSFLRPGDALYARFAMTSDKRAIDMSQYCDIEKYGFVHQINLRDFTVTPGAAPHVSVTTTISITLSITYCYMYGDKVCARYSQKGVIGTILPRHELGRIVGGPFAGAAPDIIIAPTVLPTRMTVAIITELMASKAALLTCEQQNATPYRHRYGVSDEFRLAINPQTLKYAEILKDHDCDMMEKMRLPNGVTDSVLFGPIRYLMLRHHGVTKTRRAPYDPSRVGGDIFRQSTRGRQGNLRIGYQEGQGYYSAGMSHLLESLMSMGAIREKVLCCHDCGIFVTLPSSSGVTDACDVCYGQLKSVDTVYSLLVLIHILASRGIDLRFYTN